MLGKGSATTVEQIKGAEEGVEFEQAMPREYYALSEIYRDSDRLLQMIWKEKYKNHRVEASYVNLLIKIHTYSTSKIKKWFYCSEVRRTLKEAFWEARDMVIETIEEDFKLSNKIERKEAKQ